MKKLEIFITYTEEYPDFDGVYYAQAVMKPETLILEESDAVRLQEALYKLPLDAIESMFGVSYVENFDVIISPYDYKDDKDYADELYQQAMDKLTHTYLPKAWQNKVSNPTQLIDQLCTAQTYPSKENVLKALELTAPEDVKVVILGQDPYHTPGAAQGLSFSVPDDKPAQPSLRNILKELKDDIGERESHDLTNWAKQGVLLLNTVLTVRKGAPNSHANLGWEKFTDEIITYLDSLDQPIVFILWGNYAQKKESLITNKYIIKSPHPSPFSAHRGFFGSKPFSKANDYLIANGVEPIDWIRHD